jgi:tRNA(Arg) A34 adenosine deaminase TadA
MITDITLTLPDWISTFLKGFVFPIKDLEDRMHFVLKLAEQNIKSGSGGPFAAAVFNKIDGSLISLGVNRVMPESCSVAHAEMMALMLAQKTLSTFDLSSKGDYQLITSAKMCIMCLGGVIWSGIKEVVYSADTCDVESLTGFDEGPVPKDYEKELNLRGIQVIPCLCQKEGRAVLKLYKDLGGFIYNSQNNPLGHSN